MAVPYLIGSFDSNNFTGSSQAITISTPVNPGDAIAVVSNLLLGQNLASCTDSNGDTYSTHTSNTTDTYTSYATAVCPAGLTTAQTITPTLAGSVSAQQWTLAAYGIPAISAFDTGTSWAHGDSISPVTPTLTNAPAGNTIMVFLIANAETSETPSSGYTQIGTYVASSTGYNMFCNYKQNATTSETPGATFHDSGNFWLIVACAFIPATPVVGAIPQPGSRHYRKKHKHYQSMMPSSQPSAVTVPLAVAQVTITAPTETPTVVVPLPVA